MVKKLKINAYFPEYKPKHADYLYDLYMVYYIHPGPKRESSSPISIAHPAVIVDIFAIEDHKLKD